MRDRLVLGFAVSLLAAGSVFAQGETPTAPPSTPTPTQTTPPQTVTTSPAPAAEDSDRDKVICKKVDVPGTRIGGKKVCKTKREWAEIQRENADAVRSAQDAGLRNNPTSGSGN
jgi:hypothetical protein